MKSRICIFLMLCLGLFSCKAKQYTFKENPGIRLQIGEGGGFAGSFTQKTLFKNGQTYLQEGLGEDIQKELTSLKKKESKNIFKELLKLDFKNIKYNKSGNMYQFIKLVDGEKEHKVQWPLGDKEVNKEVTTLYKKLNELIK